MKGRLNEYELDLLRQRSVEARRAKAQRGELLVAASVGYIKTEEHFEKDPDRRVQRAIGLVFDKFLELGRVRQTLMWFLEQVVSIAYSVLALAAPGLIAFSSNVGSPHRSK